MTSEELYRATEAIRNAFPTMEEVMSFFRIWAEAETKDIEHEDLKHEE